MKSSTIADPVAAPQPDSLLFGPFFGLLRKSLSAAVGGLIGRVARRRERRLLLCEMVSLGERRLVALIQFDNQLLLVGVTGNAITLLTTPSASAAPVPPISDPAGAPRISGAGQ